MDSIENLLEQEIQKLRTGKHHPAPFAAAQTELAELAAIASQLQQLPKREVPKPVMLRRYILAAQTQGRRSGWFIFSRVLVPAALSLVLVLVGTASYIANKSLPGESGFALKKATERVQLMMTTDPIARANLEVALAQKRLNEAETVFQNPNQDPQLEIAALNELADQTNNTLEQVKTVASSKAIDKVDHPIINSIETLSQKQQDLVAKVQSQSSLKGQASSALQLAKENQNKVKEIKQLVIAASNEQSLANLSPATTTPASQASSVAPTLKHESEKKESSTSTPVNPKTAAPSSAPVDPNTATGGYILEDPAPQFNNGQ